MSRKQMITNALLLLSVLALFVGFLLILWKIAQVLILILISAILASGLSPLVRRAREWTLFQKHAAMAIPFVFFSFLFFLFLLSLFIFVPVKRETGKFIEHFPEYVEKVEGWVLRWEDKYPWLPDVEELLNKVPKSMDVLTENAGQAALFSFRVVGGIFSVLMVFVLAFYMLMEAEAMQASCLQLFENERLQESMKTVLQKTSEKFSAWVGGRILLSLVIFALSTTALLLFGIPYALLLGFLAGVLDLIPFIGPLIAAVPAVIVALTLGAGKAAGVGIAYLIIQQMEGAYFVPKIMSRTVGISPLLTILAILIGAKLLGIVGILLAVPIAAALQVIAGEALRLWREVH